MTLLYRTVHAQQRAVERLGFSPTEAQWADAVGAIMDTVSGERRAALLQSKTDGPLERWRVKLAGHEVSVIYSPEEAVVVTVMSGDMVLGKHLVRRYGKRMG